MQTIPRFHVRSDFRPGDLGRITEMHGWVYARENGWNAAFEAYVAQGLARFVLRNDPRTDRLWVAEEAGRLAGCIAIVGQDDRTAQLRWFLLHPDARGRGLGRQLLDTALAFCHETGFDSVFLLTVAGLPASAHLYRSAGFRVTEERAHADWGSPVTEQRMELRLRS